MTEKFVSQIKSELCPDGVWRLSDRVRNILQRHITRLPNGNVSEEAMYPCTASGMRAFLEVFFSRHFFQVQNSLLDYVESDDFASILKDGEIRILDIGCGPAVGALAITDLIDCAIKNLYAQHYLRQRRPVEIVYVLNDTSVVCLETAQRMLADYFAIGQSRSLNVRQRITLTSARGFPDNMSQLERISSNLGEYHIISFSYVVRPLIEDSGLEEFADELSEVEKLCDRRGRMLILQDKYRKALMRRIGREAEISVKGEKLTQEIFPDRNITETQTYSYYYCLYRPVSEGKQQLAKRVDYQPRQLQMSG